MRNVHAVLNKNGQQSSSELRRLSGYRPSHFNPVTSRKFLIKAVHKGEKVKKDSGKIFTLRNVNPVCVSKVEDLKSLIKAQLTDDLGTDSMLGMS